MFCLRYAHRSLEGLTCKQLAQAAGSGSLLSFLFLCFHSSFSPHFWVSSLLVTCLWGSGTSVTVHQSPKPAGAGFLLVDALQCYPWDARLQTSSPPRVSLLNGVSSSHQHALAHKVEKTNASPGKQIRVSRAQQAFLLSAADSKTQLESRWQRHTQGCRSITLGPRAVVPAYSSRWTPRFKPYLTGCPVRDHCCPPFPPCFPPSPRAWKEGKM